jgi:hypothetical protein
MKKVSMFAAFALSFLLAASLLVLQPSEAWTSLPKFEATWAGGPPSIESANDVAVAADGSVYTVGSTGSFAIGGAGDLDALILKYDRKGNLLWARTWGGSKPDEALGVAYARGEFIYVVGRTESFGQGGYDAFILKFRSNGALDWEYTWGGPSFDEATDVAVQMGLIYVVGRTWSFGVNCDAFALLFLTNGVLFRQQTWGGSQRDAAEAVAVGSNGIYVVGYTDSFGAPWIDDAFIVKFDIFLNVVWQETWGGTSDEATHGVAVDSNNKYIYVVGMTRSYTPPIGDFEAFILKLDSFGAWIWDSTWGGPNADIAGGVAVMGTTDIYVVGEAWSFSPTPVRPSAFALHVDSAGNLVDEVAWAGSSGVVSATDVAVGPKPSTGPYIYISGSTYCSPPFSYLTPVGSNYVRPIGCTPVPITGSVTTNPNVAPIGSAGTVQTPHGNPTYSAFSDATLINIWP